MAYFVRELGEKAKVILEKNDYYDKEINDGYVVYFKDLFEFASIPVEAEIVDEGTTWNCWLFSAEYVPHTKEYELIYKAY